MLSLNLQGRRALVAGVADGGGFGFAIAKALAEAGASVCVGTWPPAMGVFEGLLRRGKLDEARKLSNGSLLEFERVYAFDAAYDNLDEVPEEVRSSKRYSSRGDYTVCGLANALQKDFGDRPIDILVHSLANGPEVAKDLIDVSRSGYLSAVSVSTYSLVSMVRHLAPLMRRDGSVVSLTYLASERVVPGYGGGMSSAKAALESDTRFLAFQAGRRYGLRVNTISAGPFASRAASATGIIGGVIEHYRRNSPLPQTLTTEEVANAAVFLCSPLASGITGATIYVDKGYHAMGKTVDDG